MPLSHTSIRTRPCTRRTPSATLPFGLYRNALVRKFCTTRRSNFGSDFTIKDDGIMVNSIPCCFANALNSAFKLANTSLTAKPCTLTSSLPDSKREISSKSPIKSSAAPNALSMWVDSFWVSLSLATSDSEEANRRAAFSGCIKS